MKIRNLALFLPVACLSYVAVSTGQEADESAPGKLIRVQPAPEDEGELGFATGEFDPSHWELLLQEVDLDEREAHFERLIERAGDDVRARDFLKELARDTGRRELAWTARLALRELANAPERDFFGLKIGGELPRSGLFFDALPPELQLFQMPNLPDLQEFQGRLKLGGQGSSFHHGKSVSIQQGEDGWVIRITEQEDGEERTREYKGANLDEILEQNPELQEELEVGGGVLGGPSGMNWFEREGGSLFPDHVLRFGTEGPRMLFSRRAPSQPVRTDVLGVRVGQVSPTRAAELGLADGLGVYVDSVFPGTLAHILGLGPGDVITRLNGRELRGAEDITETLRALPDGEGVKVEWVDALGEKQVRSWSPEQRPRKF